jgi:hypothetical protein
MSMTRLPITLVLMMAVAGSGGVTAQDSLELEGTEITGNKELPMVLYIVPWKSAERFDIQSPPITSIMDQPLKPIERTAFKRSINYHQAIFSTPRPLGPASE